MISSANSAISSLPISTPAQNNAPSSDDSSSFSDVMQQQQQTPTPQTSTDTASTPPPSSTSPSSNATTQDSDSAPSDSTPSDTPTTPPTAPAAPAKTSTTPVAAGSDLSAMIIQASVLATNLQQALAAKSSANPAVATSDTAATKTPGKNAPATAADLSALIAQATSLLSGATVAAKTSATATTTTSSKSSKDSGTTTTATDLSTLIAQASILGAGSAATIVAGTNTPVSTSGKAITGVPTKEKKSTASVGEGSFLQSGTSSAPTTANALSLLGALSSAVGDSSVNQTLTNVVGSKNSAVSALASGANSLAGTANDEREKAMSTTLISSATDLLSATGANAAAAQAQPDLQIKLSSNTDFTDALKQVMHVANLTQTSESRTPMRVEMEIQTPPGAIVNIYVSKSGDGLRAQLSTNDPVALAWVQTQMSSLKNTSGLGVEVKWAPPQMETGPSITTSGSQDANLSWNQGGGQSNYQQPDERQQNGQQQADEPELETAGSNLFMNSLTSAARAA